MRQFLIIITVYLIFTLQYRCEASPCIAAGDSGYPPYEFLNDKGVPEGFNIDLIHGIAEIGGIDLRIELMPWKEAVSRFESREVSCITGIFQTPERTEEMLFSRPYITVSYSLFAKKDSPLKKIADFRYVTIAVQRGNYAGRYAATSFPECRLLEVENEKEGLLLVSNGKADSVLMSEMSAYFYINMFKLDNLKRVPETLFTMNYCAAFHKNDESSRMLFDEGISLMRASGRYEEIYSKWFGGGNYILSRNYPRIFMSAAVVLAFISAIIVLFIMLLRKQVKLRTTDLRRETYINYYIADLSRKLLADVSIDNISKVVLEYLTDLTSSSNGLAGFIDKNSPGILTPFFYEKNGDEIIFRKVTLNTEKIVSLMVSVLEKKEPFFINELSESPMINDLPSDHIELKNVISSPAILGGEAVGFILLANSSRKYGSADINIIENFSSQYALAIQRMWFENELVESEKRYRDMFDNVADMLYIYDLKGNLIDANKSFKRLFGYTGGDIKKLNIIEMLSGMDGSIYNRNDLVYLLDKVRTRGYLNGEVEINDSNGEKRVLEFKNSLITDESGKPAGVRGSARDITDRKMFEKVLIEAKEKASDSDRLKSNFIANMSHEIRTPLNAILGFTDMLIEEVTDSNHRNYLGMIQNSGKLLLSIIDDILDLSKIESGALKISTAPVNVRTLLYNAYNRGVVLLKNKSRDVEMINEIEDDIPDLIYGDSYRIEQVLNNLIMNAVKFTSHGTIKISLKLRSDFTLEFSVEDTGIGIAPENIKMIFERFRQVDGDSRRSFGGTGLGLAISKMIVELMGGNIYVKSESGHGSKFIFTIPYRPAFEKEFVPEKSPEKRREKGNRIMVVEDNSINRTLVTRVLEKRGYSTLMAVDGFEAVDLVKKGEHIDLILMDIQMPGMDGMEALKLIRLFEESSGSTGRIPVIALSAHVMKDDVDRFLGAGFDSYVAKPFNSNDLIERIETLIK